MPTFLCLDFNSVMEVIANTSFHLIHHSIFVFSIQTPHSTVLMYILSSYQATNNSMNILEH
jgi:hypothetical protein